MNARNRAKAGLIVGMLGPDVPRPIDPWVIDVIEKVLNDCDAQTAEIGRQIEKYAASKDPLDLKLALALCTTSPKP